MIRFHSNHSQHLPVLAVLLVCAQLFSALGFPMVVGKFKGRTVCGTSTCGCSAEDKASSRCCCSKGRSSYVLNEPASCCSKIASKKSASCCSTKPDAKPTCEHAGPADGSLTVVWVIGLSERSCKGETHYSGLSQVPVSLPAVIAVIDYPTVDDCGSVSLLDRFATSTGHPPDSPPPKV